MFSSIQKYFFISLFFIFICFMGLVFTLNSSESLTLSENNFINSDITFSGSNLIWPVPNYTTITSYFGYRKAPTSGAGTFHGGIDIGAPSGTKIVASFSGEVTYIGFSGANGYTVSISNGYYSSNYSHVSSYFLVYLGQTVNKGDIIATIGPKNVYDVPNNPYKDANGNPTNGATTGPHLHFSLKIDGKTVNPLHYF